MIPPPYNFVFGYGSLMCAESRAITSPETGNKVATPVVVQGLERTWAKRTKRGMTAMGVRFVEEVECVGVILPVNQEELRKFDKREQGYDRVLLETDDVDVVTFLDDEHYDAEDHQVFLEEKEKKKGDLRIWVYVQRDPKPPTPEHPIAQTYVDTILRGCLDISEEFASEFISTTKGWHPEELEDIGELLSEDSDGNANANMTEGGSHWVDDRHDPIYPRGDPAYSSSQALASSPVRRAEHRALNHCVFLSPSETDSIEPSTTELGHDCHPTSVVVLAKKSLN
jgi:cation transport regulator ChaC